ncbi:MAG: ATP-binding protein, partial [Desulfocucumaceae bacterium]
DRANEIISEFLSTARDKHVEMKKQNLNSIINKMLPLISANAQNTKSKAVFRQGNIPDIMLNEKEIRQLILNLTRNGLEAMEAGGEITISTYTEDAEVILSVKDQGEGIDPLIIDNLGTPFYTTKENGTGLGLAICYGIADRHNATIQIKSGDGGSCFLISFKP